MTAFKEVVGVARRMGVVRTGIGVGGGYGEREGKEGASMGERGSSYAYYVAAILKKLNGVSAGKLLFAARLPCQSSSFSVLAHCQCANLQHIQSSQCCCDLYGSKMDQQQHRRSNEPPIALPPDQKSQAAADKASCMIWDAVNVLTDIISNILTRCSQIMNIPWIVPASDFSVASFIFMPDSDSVTLQSLEPVLLTDTHRTPAETALTGRVGGNRQAV